MSQFVSFHSVFYTSYNVWIVYIDQLTMRGDPLVTRVCSQHRYTRHKAAVLLLFHKGYKVAPNILRNIKFVPKRC